MGKVSREMTRPSRKQKKREKKLFWRWSSVHRWSSLPAKEIPPGLFCLASVTNYPDSSIRIFSFSCFLYFSSLSSLPSIKFTFFLIISLPVSGIFYPAIKYLVCRCKLKPYHLAFIFCLFHKFTPVSLSLSFLWKHQLQFFIKHFLSWPSNLSYLSLSIFPIVWKLVSFHFASLPFFSFSRWRSGPSDQPDHEIGAHPRIRTHSVRIGTWPDTREEN